MGLPKIMPHFAVGSIQTGLRKGFPSSVVLLRRVLLGWGDGCWWSASGFHHSSRTREGRFSQSTAPQNPRTDPSPIGGTGAAVERRGESAPSRPPSQYPATAARDRTSFRPVSAALLVILRGYKLLISPLLPSACRFYPTCSCYMHDAIGTHGAGRGIYYGIRRLLKCHPWHPGGIDPVPPQSEIQRTELHGRQ